MVILQESNKSGNTAETEYDSGNSAEKAIRVHISMRVVILQRECDSVAHFKKSGNTAKRVRWQRTD